MSKKISFCLTLRLASVFALILPASLNAQEMYPDRTGKTMYFGIMGTYAGNLIGTTGSFPNYESHSSGTASGQTKHFSLGQGPGAGMYCGYMLNRNFGFELGVLSIFHSPVSGGWQSTDTNNLFQSFTFKTSAKIISFIPALRMQVGEKKIHLFTRTGLILGIPFGVVDETEQEVLRTPGMNRTQDHFSWRYYGHLSYGFMGAAGALYQLNSRFSIIAECFALIQRWAPAHREMITEVYNGVDLMPGSTISQKQTDYVLHPAETQDPNRPSQVRKYFIPLDAFGFNVGLHMKFGKNFKNDNAHYNLN
jgi:hypothetical protein